MFEDEKYICKYCIHCEVKDRREPLNKMSYCDYDGGVVAQ